MTITEAARGGKNPQLHQPGRLEGPKYGGIANERYGMLCMLVRTKKNEGQYLVGPLWEPQREDLVADDWRVLSLEKLPDDFQRFVKAALEAVIEVSNPMFG